MNEEAQSTGSEPTLNKPDTADAPEEGNAVVGRSDPSAATLRVQRFTGIYLTIVGLVLLHLVYSIWPRTVSPAEGTTAPQQVVLENANENEEPDPLWKEKSKLFWTWNLDITENVRILLLVILIGALGSVVGGATSFATYVGNKTFEASWTWWYFLRPLVGAMLALTLYLAIRGNFAAFADGPRLENLMSAAAVAALAGMFSKHTADKLEQIFATILNSDKDDERDDKAKPNEANTAQ